MSSKSPLVPKLRFPDFRGTGGWAIPKLGSIGFFTGGGTPSKDKTDYWIGVNPWVSSSDVFEDGIHDISISRYISDEAVQATATKVVPANSILLVSRVGVGKLAISRTPICTSQDFTNFTPAKDNLVFLAYCIKSLKAKLLAFNQGMAIKGFTKDDVSNLGIPLPKLAEQQKIADCLSSLDELIAAQARKVDALKTHKKGLMQQLFPREGETQPRLRFPEFRDAGKWEKMTLGTAANFYNGRAYKQEELLDAGKYKVLRVGNFFTNNNWYHSNLELDETKYCEDGDLLYAWSASFGPRVWRGEKTIYHYHIWKVVEHSGIDKQFLFIILEHETERMKAKTTNGLGIMHITKGAIEGWESFFPGLAEQRKIADRLINLDGVIAAEARKLELLAEHKKALMQQIFPSIDGIKI